MHSYQGKTHNFHFNGDFSGEIHIIDKETNQEMKIESEDILKLVAEYYIKPKRISEIEDMEYKEILK
jgi:hypothetical protein